MLQLQLMKIARSRKGSGRSVAIAKAIDAPRVPANRRANRKKIADEVKYYIESNGISRLDLEKLVKRSKSTMDHFFAGDFADPLLARVEHALGRRFIQSSSSAPDEWGGYTFEGTSRIAGSYLTLRPDFKEPIKICAYVTTIEWGNIEQAHIFDGQLVRKPRIDGFGLVFREERRADHRFTHRGQVWMPSGQYLYFVSAYGDGRLRAAIASVPDNGRMTGIQLSLSNHKGAAYTPAATAIAFIRREKIEDDELGTFLPGQERYDRYKEIVSGAISDVLLSIPPDQTPRLPS